jgi:hypothetical protein
MLKYPRTPHLEGSRAQPGDEDMDAVPFSAVRGKPLVVEEKVDGANAGLRFDGSGELYLQSRGHFLTGGAREKHFAMFKQWATAHASVLFARLGARYALYGEWLYAKHTVFYDALSHFFLEYDVLDIERECFLSTTARRELLRGLPIVSVPVLWEGAPRRLEEVTAHVGPSRMKSPRWRQALTLAAERLGLDPARIRRETDPSDDMEGLYVKHEENGQVLGRYKYIRLSFLTSVVDSGSHWLTRPVVPNELAPGVDVFAP